MTTVVRIRDKELRTVDEVTLFSASTVVKYCDVSRWKVELPRDVVDSIDKGFGVYVYDEADPDTPLFAGPFDQDSVEAAADSKARILTLEGFTDSIHLDDRLVWANPTQTWGNQGATSYWTQEASPEKAMSDLVRYNLGDLALVERRQYGLTVPSWTAQDYTVSINARHTTVLEELQALAKATETHAQPVGFRVRQVDEAIELQFVYPQDRSGYIYLDRETGNVQGYKYGRKAPTVTHALVTKRSGDVSAPAVTVEDNDTSGEWGRRAEKLVARSDSDNDTVLLQAGQEALTEGSQSMQAVFDAVEPVDMRYGIDWHLGDIISAGLTDEELPVVDRVRQVKIGITPEGRTIRPVLGADNAWDEVKDSKLRIQLAEALKRLSKLESQIRT